MDTSTLRIAPRPTRTPRRPAGQYEEQFKALNAINCIECKPDEAALIARNLRSWLKARSNTARVRNSCTDEDGIGRVWIEPSTVTSLAARRA